MDELSKAIDSLNEKLIQDINEAQLHPRIVEMMLGNLINQIHQITLQQPQEQREE